MSNQPPIDREELARRLRASIAQKRPRRLRILVTTLLVVAVPLGVFAWLVWPRPELPRLHILALDQVTDGKSAIPLEAWLAPQDPTAMVRDLAGLEVSFEVLSAPANEIAAVQARSDSAGMVKANLNPFGRGIEEYKVTYISSRQRYHTEDRAHLYAWDDEAPLLVVEVNALTTATPDVWQPGRFRDLAASEGAGKALQAAQKKGYHLVYVAAGAAAPVQYRLMRGWVEKKAQVGEPFPEGPVLGMLLPGQALPPATAWGALVNRVSARRPGCVAVARDSSLAIVFRDAGAMTYVLADAGEAPPNTTRLANWAAFKEKALK
jgi:hypothetical protein